MYYLNFQYVEAYFLIRIFNITQYINVHISSHVKNFSVLYV